MGYLVLIEHIFKCVKVVAVGVSFNKNGLGLLKNIPSVFLKYTTIIKIEASQQFHLVNFFCGRPEDDLQKLIQLLLLISWAYHLASINSNNLG